MQVKRLSKALATALMAGGLTFGASQAAHAESYAFAFLELSDFDVQVDNSTSGLLSPVPGFGGSTSFNAGTLSTVNGTSAPATTSGNGTSLFTTQTQVGSYDVGSPAATDFNGAQTPTGPSAYNGARADVDMPETRVINQTGSRINAQLVAESDAQGPPIPSNTSAGSSIANMIWSWNVSQLGVIGDSITVSFTSLLDIIVETAFLNPTVGDDDATASASAQVFIGGLSAGQVFVGQNGSSGGPQLFEGDQTFDIVETSNGLGELGINDQLSFNIFLNVNTSAESNTFAPEPGALALMSGAMLLLGGMSRRRLKGLKMA